MDKPVEVTDAVEQMDREFAANFARKGWRFAKRIREGKQDDYPLVQAAAQHRLAHSAPTGEMGEYDRGLASVWAQAERSHADYSGTGDHESDIRFLTLGLTGETGEVMTAILEAASLVAAGGRTANLVKKRWRDGDGHDQAIRYEIADVCAYAFMLASTMGMTPADLIETIAEKQRVFVLKMQARNLEAQPR